MIKQLKVMIKIFEVTHLNCIGIFTFDQSSAHEGFAEDSLKVKKMNVNPAKKQSRLRDTIIPLSNPDPAPGEEDTRGRIQHMCFPADHPDPNLRDKPKRIRAVLEERKSVWDRFTTICRECGKKVVGKCAACTKSELSKDKERSIAIAEAMEQGEVPLTEDTFTASEIPSNTTDEWCCMYKTLSLQDDFQSEKPLIQLIIEHAGHVCLFLPRFHCELNAIEMLWGFRKYRAHILSLIDAMCLSKVAGRLSKHDRWKV